MARSRSPTYRPTGNDMNIAEWVLVLVLWTGSPPTVVPVAPYPLSLAECQKHAADVVEELPDGGPEVNAFCSPFNAQPGRRIIYVPREGLF